MFSSSISNNVTLSPSVNAGVPLTLAPPLPGLQDDHRPQADFRLDNLPEFHNGTVISTNAFGPSPSRAFLPGQHVFDRTIGERTVTEWIARYGEVLWKKPAGNTTSAEGLRQTVIDALGGRKTPQGEQASRQFSEVYRYLNHLGGARDWYLARFPSHAAIIQDGADYMMDRAVGHLARGFHEGDASATFRVHIEPRIAAAEREREAARVDQERQLDAARARQLKLDQIRGIDAFWHTVTQFTYEWLRYIFTGENCFADAEEMERNCPPGDFTTVYDPRVDRMMPGPFAYQGGHVQKVFLPLPGGGEREVSFYGPYWIYTDQDPRSWGVPADLAVVPEQHRHINPHWNDDPEVVRARVVGSGTNRGN